MPACLKIARVPAVGAIMRGPFAGLNPAQSISARRKLARSIDSASGQIGPSAPAQPSFDAGTYSYHISICFAGMYSYHGP
jgi:hypothetical protein